MTATRLGILIGIVGALAFFAWRVVDEYERELAEARRPAILPGRPNTSWVAVSRTGPRPRRPKPVIGPDRPDPRDAERGASDRLQVFVLTAIGALLLTVLAIAVAGR